MCFVALLAMAVNEMTWLDVALMGDEKDATIRSRKVAELVEE